MPHAVGGQGITSGVQYHEGSWNRRTRAVVDDGTGERRKWRIPVQLVRPRGAEDNAARLTHLVGGTRVQRGTSTLHASVLEHRIGCLDEHGEPHRPRINERHAIGHGAEFHHAGRAILLPRRIAAGVVVLERPKLWYARREPQRTANIHQLLTALRGFESQANGAHVRRVGKLHTEAVRPREAVVQQDVGVRALEAALTAGVVEVAVLRQLVRRIGSNERATCTARIEDTLLLDDAPGLVVDHALILHHHGRRRQLLTRHDRGKEPGARLLPQRQRRRAVAIR